MRPTLVEPSPDASSDRLLQYIAVTGRGSWNGPEHAYLPCQALRMPNRPS